MSVPYADPATQFAWLFRGLKRGYGLLEGRNVPQPLSLGLYRAHLAGKRSIGIYPMADDGRWGWAAIDIDTGQFRDAERAFEALYELGFNSGVHVFTSRQKGFHVILFVDDWTPSATLRRIMRGALHLAGLHPGTEIFPKQDGFDNVTWGNYLNLPFFGRAEPGRRVALDPRTWQPISLVDFLASVQPFPVAALDVVLDNLPEMPATSAAAGVLPRDPAWKTLLGPIYATGSVTPPEGATVGRHAALLRLGCYLRDYLPQPVTEAILLAVNEARCVPPYDEEHIRQTIVADIYQRSPQPGEQGPPRAIVPGSWTVSHE